MASLEDYPFEIRRMAPDEGTGYWINFPDFNTCISDGETVEEAIINGRDALQCAIDTLEDLGWPVPAPDSHRGSYANQSTQAA
ncbi:MAG: type II toxin-antitoxin system HicB family antitoxin [Magnetococcales bacterium]|nr:type II toxin-antitoxin system HicB family antitoxin [Magnetococcales bacterium]